RLQRCPYWWGLRHAPFSTSRCKGYQKYPGARYFRDESQLAEQERETEPWQRTHRYWGFIQAEARWKTPSTLSASRDGRARIFQCCSRKILARGNWRHIKKPRHPKERQQERVPAQYLAERWVGWRASARWRSRAWVLSSRLDRLWRHSQEWA